MEHEKKYGEDLRVEEGADEIILKINLKELDGESEYAKVCYLNFLRDKHSLDSKFFTVEPKEAQDLLEKKRHDNHVYEYVKEHNLGSGFLSTHRTIEKVLKNNAYTLDESKAMLLIKTLEKYAKLWDEEITDIPKFREEKFVISTNNVDFFEKHKETGLSLQVLSHISNFYKIQYCKKHKIEPYELKESFTHSDKTRGKAFDYEQNSYINTSDTENKDWNVFCHLVSISEVAVDSSEIVEFETRKNKIHQKILNEELQSKTEVRKRVRP